MKMIVNGSIELNEGEIKVILREWLASKRPGGKTGLNMPLES